jgi:hypothetical protein
MIPAAQRLDWIRHQPQPALPWFEPIVPTETAPTCAQFPIGVEISILTRLRNFTNLAKRERYDRVPAVENGMSAR